MKHKLLLGILAIIIVIGAVFVIKNYKGEGAALLYKASTKVAELPPLSPGQTCPASGYKFVKIISNGVGSGNGQFVYPAGITTDSSNNVYVSDSKYNPRIQKFTSAGTFSMNFNTPTIDVVTGSNGDIYTTDYSNNFVRKYTPAGTFSNQWLVPGQNLGIWGIARDSLGNIYVVATNDNRIQKFSSSGTYISQWGTTGSGNGQFNHPANIAINAANEVFVADSNNNRIQKFSSSGAYISQWGTFGSGNGQFNSPTGIAVDSTGNIYVTDANNRIQKFSPTGTYLTSWGTSGSGNGQLSGPVDVAVDSLGNVYVTEENNSRVQKFSPCTPIQLGTAVNTISGKVYYDQNKNGAWNTAEHLYSNVVIGLYTAGQSTPIQTTTTQSAGDYTFANVPNGTYYVALQSEAPYSLITQPAAASGLVAGHTYVYTVTVNPSTSAQGSTNRDFGTYVFN